MLDTDQDLTFAPVANAAPKRLSADHIAAYNADGFVQPFDVFTASEMTDIRAYVDQMMRAMGPEGAYGINCYQARMAGLWDIATDPRILDLVEDLMGPDILCWASAILSKAPRDPKRVPWHQDASFWALCRSFDATVPKIGRWESSPSHWG